MKFMLLMLSFISFSAAAENIKFKCDFSGETYVPQFALTGSVFNENGSFYNADLDFKLRKAGRDQRTERLSLTRDGVVQVLEAGTHYPHKITRLMSVVKGADIEYINILVDVPTLYMSQIRFLSGVTYYGTCKSL